MSAPGWVIQPELGPAMPIIFSMHCRSCDAASPPDADFEPMHDWTLRHVAGNPEHTDYREVIHRTWRAVEAL
ncbi:hypothetical protein GCM10020221_25170 [Streptomyces thioluteus]|uniref:DUF7848 domain-containing protein n=2 Tax=Streptomyces thioluteus TaxID=66431 RepID=A0ABP6JBQ5_STRTU